ncbi:MAG: Hsp70 family protein, partial [Gammaproteobacteria bacterium]|nr:Hsp70 family protein [Gammaproteobacteria bacterium]
RILVTFQVDADGLLEVTAREQNSGVESSVQVKPSYGLSDNEIERMLRENIEHASDDVEARMLREQQVEADRVLEAIGAALAEDGEALLTPDERAVIDTAMDALRQARENGATADIKQAINVADKATADFAARRMDASINKALSGHTLEEFE